MPHRTPILVVALLLAGGALASCENSQTTAPDTRPVEARQAQTNAQQFTDQFHLERCTFITKGRNPFLVLVPGYTQVLEGTDAGAPASLTITVLDATAVIGGVTTRIIEERHVQDGVLVEISRNYFAICRQNNSVFYFGEDTDIYANGQIVSHAGSWHHGANGARAGLIMPGIQLLGSRYFQEIAPGVATDQAEITALETTVTTPLRTFTGVLVTRETSPLNPTSVDFKSFAPGVGLVKSNDLLLVKAEYHNGDNTAGDGEQTP